MVIFECVKSQTSKGVKFNTIQLYESQRQFGLGQAKKKQRKKAYALKNLYNSKNTMKELFICVELKVRLL